MKTDRELLELAAKALHMDNPEWVFTCNSCDSWRMWDPLVYDEEAFDLMVRLGIEVSVYGVNVGARYLMGNNRFMCVEPLGKSRHHATRRAITRAAAAIGESMP